MSPPPLPPLSLYVHFPWCVRKCPYCDFNSHALASAGVGARLDATLETQYLSALEADLVQALPSIWGRRVVSVFMGGGTPSLLSPAGIDHFLSRLRALVPLLADAEITLEANPGTFERHRFAAYAQAGVTRLSIGVQSFNDTLLKRIGRSHSAHQALAAAQEAAAHFAQWNLDLMYALPGQTRAELAADVAQALALAPRHLSMYHLSLEPNTAFYRHPPTLPDDDSAYAMQDDIMAAAQQAGLARYEVSAFAKPGFECQHNSNYWAFGDYLGIGAGAHSKISHARSHALRPLTIERSRRWREPARYLQAALQGQAISHRQAIASPDIAGEYMMNALRLVQGFALHDFYERTGLGISAIAHGLEQAQAQGWIARDHHRVWPTARGLDFLSDVQCLFLA